MNAQATRRGAPAVVLWGGLGALAWAAITVLTGGSSAHADEQSDPSVLGDVGSLVSETVATVGDTVTAVTQPVVTEVVAPVVTEVIVPVVAPVQHAAPPVVESVAETVAEVPVVGPVAAPVAESVADSAHEVVAPVTDLLQDAPVSQVVTPVQDAVSALPIVGALVDRLGVDTVLTDIVGVLDNTTDVVGGTVKHTVPPVLEALTPTPPDDDRGSAVVVVPSPATAVPSTITARGIASTFSMPAVSAQGTTLPGHRVVVGDPEPTGGELSADDGRTPPPVGSPVAPVSSASSGGASALSHARTGDVGFAPLRAAERSSGAPDDVLPTSPVADTDVSPD